MEWNAGRIWNAFRRTKAPSQAALQWARISVIAYVCHVNEDVAHAASQLITRLKSSGLSEEQIDQLAIQEVVTVVRSSDSANALSGLVSRHGLTHIDLGPPRDDDDTTQDFTNLNIRFRGNPLRLKAKAVLDLPKAKEYEARRAKYPISTGPPPELTLGDLEIMAESLARHCIVD